MSLPATRERLILAMARSLQSRGLHGAGINEIIAAADAPKGVLYHHFPGGKHELASAAIRQSAARICHELDSLAATGAPPVRLLRDWFGSAQRHLARSAFERGCPLATVALETTAADTDLRTVLADAFGALRHSLQRALVTAGVSDSRAAHWAALLIAAYEGGLVQARVAGSLQPMTAALDMLLDLLDAELTCSA